MIFLAFSIWSLGAGHWIEPSSSLIDGVAWYSGRSGLAFFAGDLSLDGACLRFILGAFGVGCEARDRICVRARRNALLWIIVAGRYMLIRGLMEDVTETGREALSFLG
jgi:hypothetical protein